MIRYAYAYRTFISDCVKSNWADIYLYLRYYWYLMMPVNILTYFNLDNNIIKILLGDCVSSVWYALLECHVNLTITAVILTWKNHIRISKDCYLTVKLSYLFSQIWYIRQKLLFKTCYKLHLLTKVYVIYSLLVFLVDFLIKFWFLMINDKLI